MSKTRFQLQPPYCANVLFRPQYEYWYVNGFAGLPVLKPV